MSWHFSQALVEDFSQATDSDSELFAPLRETCTPVAYCWRDRTTEICDLFQYGMMSEPSTGGLGEDLLTWFREDFRVKTSAPQAKALASPVSDPGYGRSSPESSEKSSRRGSSSKTATASGQEGLTLSSPTLPVWGMMRNGELSQLQMPSGLKAHRQSITSEGVAGSLRMPTPCATEVEKNLENYQSKASRPRKEKGGGHGPNLATAVRMPTPTTQDNYQTKGVGARGTTLAGAVRVPTPRNNTGPDTSARHLSLCGAVRLPTPAARGHKDLPGDASQLERKSPGLGVVITQKQVGGHLNPEWGRVVDGMANRVDRIRCIGNGQVPHAAVLAWQILSERLLSRAQSLNAK